MKKEAILTSGSVPAGLLRLSFPMLFGFLSISLFNLVDTWFIARLGTLPLAAIGFIFPVVMVVGTLSISLGVGAATRVSQAIGAGDQDQVRRLTTDALLLSVLIVFAVSMLGYFFAESLFSLMGADDESFPIIMSYMRIWFAGCTFMTVPMVGSACLRAKGDTRTPAFIMSMAALLNLILDPLLIFGLFGFPAMGVAGAALATIISRGITLVLTLSVLHFRDGMLDFSLVPFQKVKQSFKAHLSVALPVSLTYLMMPVASGMITRIVANFGSDAVAALAAAMKIDALAMLPMMSLGAVMVPFVGQNDGAGEVERVHQAHVSAILFAFIWGMVCVLVLHLFAGRVARFFVDDPRVISLMTAYLWIVPFSYAFHAISRLTGAWLNGKGQSSYDALISAVRLFGFTVPFCFLGAQWLGLKGSMAGFSIGEICAGVLTLVSVRYWRRIGKV